ncbi:LuxR C-terminal-related transcriptional regulator [Caulobacter segnis]
MVATTFADERHVIASIEAGASGYLLEGQPVADHRSRTSASCTAAAARSVRASPARCLMRFRPDEKPVEAEIGDVETADRSGVPSLSEREKETLQLITRGFSFEEIAELMGVSSQHRADLRAAHLRQAGGPFED